jgi:acyl carrier protein
MQAEQLAPQAGLNTDQLLARRILSGLTTQNLEAPDIRPEMSINQDLGIDSLKFIRLILDVEAGAGRRIFDVETIASIKTVGDLYAVLQTA